MDVSTIHMTTFGQSTSQPHGTFDARLNHVNPKAEELKQRTFRFALDIIRFIRLLRETWEGRELADQLVRSGTRVGANYRAACRARSPRDFVNKIGIVVEESDETVYLLQLIQEARISTSPGLQPLLVEAAELSAIFNQSQLTAKANLRRRTPGRAGLNVARPRADQ